MPHIEFEENTDLDEAREQLELLDPGTRNRILTDDDEKIKIDISELTTVLWEHQIYEQADKSNRIEILWTIQELTETDDWAEIDEIVAAHDLKKSTVYRNIKKLREDGLVRQVGNQKSGIYEYTGP